MPVPEAPVLEAPVLEAPVLEAPVLEAPVSEQSAPSNEADLIKLWEDIKKVTSVRNLLGHAQRIMPLLASNDLRKEFCSVLIAPEFLDAAMCQPIFGWQEAGDEPGLDDLEDALGMINVHQFALKTWVEMSSKKRKAE